MSSLLSPTVAATFNNKRMNQHNHRHSSSSSSRARHIMTLCFMLTTACYMHSMMLINNNINVPSRITTSSTTSILDLLPTTATATESQLSSTAAATTTAGTVPVEDFIERRTATSGAGAVPRVYVAIASVPRANNEDYLLQVLESLQWAHFPSSHTYVFYNTNGQDHDNGNHTHLRWNQAHGVYSSTSGSSEEEQQGVKFVWNTRPTPQAHPSAYNSSLPLPAALDKSHMGEGWWNAAQGDSVSRKDWRRRECFDFIAIAKYMLAQVHHDDNNYSGDAAAAMPWIVFNQDDGVWKLPFYQIYMRLHNFEAAAEGLVDSSRGIVDLFGGGLVSVAFPANILEGLVRHGEVWCDFVPVDWMMDEFVLRVVEKIKHTEKGAVVHIGKVSSKVGRIDNLETAKKRRKVKSTTAKTPTTAATTTTTTHPIINNKDPVTTDTNSQQQGEESKPTTSTKHAKEKNVPVSRTGAGDLE